MFVCNKMCNDFAVHFQTVCVDGSNSKKFRSMFQNDQRYTSLQYTYENQRTCTSHAEHTQGVHLFKAHHLALCAI